MTLPTPPKKITLAAKVSLVVFTIGVLLALFLPDWRYAVAGLVLSVLTVAVIPA